MTPESFPTRPRNFPSISPTPSRRHPTAEGAGKAFRKTSHAILHLLSPAPSQRRTGAFPRLGLRFCGTAAVRVEGVRPRLYFALADDDTLEALKRELEAMMNQAFS